MDAQYFNALQLGLSNVLAWPTFGYLLIGIAVGLVIGALPAIGGVTGLILLLPFTYQISGPSAFALLLGMYSTVAAGDAISSILIGVPGGVGSSATILDGYPLAKRGEAARALGAAYMSCALGGLISALILALSIPIVKPLVLAFGMPEYFALALLGLVMVGIMSGKSIGKGMTVACFGLIISAVGASDFSGVPRFWFEIPYFLQQPPLIAIVLGLFGVAEMLDLAVKNSSIARVATNVGTREGTFQGILDAFRHWWLVIRSAAIGVYVGILPGIGASVVDWAAYGHAVQSAKDKSQFGKGDIRGVIAPEVANNADRGGALIPTLAFGIPGDFGMAILLGALTIQGMAPGVAMLTTNLHITFSMFWTIIIANLIGTVILLFWSRHVAKIAFMDGHMIVPCVLLFIFMGSWLGTTSMGDLILMLVAGVVGYWMKIAGWPRPPLIIALVLGNIIENSLIVSMRTYDGFSFLLRPTVLVIGALILITIVFTIRSRQKVNKKADGERKEQFAGDLVINNPLFSWPLALLMLVICVAAAIASAQMSRVNGAFPLLSAMLGMVCAALVLAHETRNLLAVRRNEGLLPSLSSGLEQAVFARSIVFLSYIGLTVLGIYLLGHRIGLPLSLGLYVVLWGRARWWMGLVFGFAVYAVIEVLYGKLLNVNLQQPLWM